MAKNVKGTQLASSFVLEVGLLRVRGFIFPWSVADGALWNVLEKLCGAFSALNTIDLLTTKIFMNPNMRH